MGVLFSRFKKKTTTLEILEGLEQEIKSIEENGVRAEQQQRRIVGHLILYSVGLYIIAAFLFYLFYFPAPLKEQLIYITPMLIFPILVVILKRLVSWYYHRKLLQNQGKLQKMREKKKKMLEEVMDKETFKVAKEILEKYAPDQLRKQAPALPVQLKYPQANATQPRPHLVPQPARQAALPDAELRRRSVGQPATNRLLPMPLEARSVSMSPVPVLGSQANNRALQHVPGPPMPRPIFPRERSFSDKLMEYILGDGPANRYALICRQCESHNGMALKEEFEYIGFRCCYCFYWNPARKQRPHGPALAQSAPVTQSSSTSSSELNSASDTEDEQSVPENNRNVSEVRSETSEGEAPKPSEEPPVVEASVAADSEASVAADSEASVAADSDAGSQHSVASTKTARAQGEGEDYNKTTECDAHVD